MPINLLTKAVSSTGPLCFKRPSNVSIDKFRAISDFISGMTDRYAINLYNNFK